MDISKFKAVIFDVDGTLYNQRPLLRAILLRFAAEYWRKPALGARTALVLQAYRRGQEELRSQPYSAGAHLNLAAEKSGVPVSEVREITERWMEAEPLDLLAPCVYSGAAGLLEELADLDIPCGIFSDYPAQDKLNAMRLTSFFNCVKCADELGWLKPDPRGLLAVLKSMGVEPGAAIYIGDRWIDHDAAIRAGMKVTLIHNEGSYSELLRGLSPRKEN
jgi:phosphoglycolate phosphatase/putative hydrolase of the HAD superfamily